MTAAVPVSAVPTRLIRAPELVKLNGRGNPRSWRYFCDDGRDYSRAQLAAIIGICGQVLLDRLKLHGWASPRIMQSKADYRAEKLRLTAARQAASRQTNNGGNSEFKSLSFRDRKARLRQLPGPGSWERQEGGL